MQDRKQRFDAVLWLCVLATCGYSVLLLLSVSRAFFTDYRMVFVQTAATAVGIACAAVLMRLGLDRIKKFIIIPLVLCALLVGATFFVGYAPQGTQAQAWLPLLFGLSFQPTELYKLVFIVTFAMQLSHFKDSINRPIPLLLSLAHIAVIAVITHFQGDDGAAMIFALIGLVMLVAAGLNIFYILGAFIVGVLFFVTVGFDMLQPYQQQRILGLLNPQDYPDIMFQQTRSVTAIGSGRLLGNGLFSYDPYYVPNSHNDFIFSYIGQVLGLAGMVLAIALLTVICVKVLRNAFRQENSLHRLVPVGVFALIAGQTLINVAMNLALIPVVGIVLPFFSAGGTAMMSCIIAVGLACSVASPAEEL